MTEERNIKIENTFSVLYYRRMIMNQYWIRRTFPNYQKRERGKKVIEGRRRGKLGKYLNEKRKIEIIPKPNFI